MSCNLMLGDICNGIMDAKPCQRLLSWIVQAMTLLSYLCDDVLSICRRVGVSLAKGSWLRSLSFAFLFTLSRIHLDRGGVKRCAVRRTSAI